MLDRDTLTAYGFAFAIYPGTGFMAAAEALRSAYGHLHEHGSTIGMTQPMYDFAAMNKLMGFEEVWEFDRKWAQD